MSLSKCQLVQDVLDLDNSCRWKTTEGISLREKDIHNFPLQQKKWGYTLPTVCPDPPSYGEEYKCPLKVYIDNDEDLWNTYLKSYPCLESVNMDNILIAGGSVLDVLTSAKNVKQNTDVDLFFCGLEEDELNERASRLVSDIATRLIKYRKEKGPDDGEMPFVLVRSENAITIQSENRCDNDFLPVQIILRSYTTPSQVLHGFDFGACSVGIWYGYKGVSVGKPKFITTSLGKFALEYGCNIFDPRRNSLNYEYRIFYKYLNIKEVSVIMPHLKVISSYSYKFNCGRIIICSARDPNPNILSRWRTGRLDKLYPKCDYAPYFPVYSSHYIAEDQIYPIQRHNISQLIKSSIKGEQPKKIWLIKVCTNPEELGEAVNSDIYPYPGKEYIDKFLRELSFLIDGYLKTAVIEKYLTEGESIELTVRLLRLKRQRKYLELDDLFDQYKEIISDRLISHINNLKKEKYHSIALLEYKRPYSPANHWFFPCLSQYSRGMVW